MNRSPQDLCLLCKKEHATKENSHIVPKFMGKSILGKSKRAGIVDSSEPFKKPPIKQDSPKQNYILCPGCEKYFETLETYCADKFFKRILNEKFTDDFQYGINEGDVEFAQCISMNNLAFRLFIYSIFWRCSISTIKPFSTFKIQNENCLNDVLMEFREVRFKDLLSKNDADCQLYDCPITIVRAKNIIKPENHFYYANSLNRNLYQLFLNEYIFFFAFKKDTTIADFGFLVNMGMEPITIGLLRDGIWLELTKGVTDLLNAKITDNASKLQL